MEKINTDYSTYLQKVEKYSTSGMIVKVFGFFILIARNFTIVFYFLVFSLVLGFIKKIYQTLKTVFDHISEHFEVRQKYTATRRIFNSLLCGLRCDQSRSFVFCIFRQQCV